MNVASRFIALVVLVTAAVGAGANERFKTPEAAAEAFVAALGTEKADADKLAALLGADWQEYIPTKGIERKDVDAFIAHYKEKHVIQTATKGRAHIVVGNDPWTLPIPIVQGKEGWSFDAKAGGEEIRQRRIGRNELSAIQAAEAYHDAQMDYAEVDRNGDGILEYAQKFISSDGQHDGLYWPDEDGTDESPLGPLFGGQTQGDDWHGYHFRILTAQGPSAPGGTYDYMLGKAMSRGFALVAWPAHYGDSGVMSFMISHEGQIFQKDLGPDSEKIAKAMKRFDPDSSWDEIQTRSTPGA
ncbi:DUF2950 domain-containing protein [Metapseudomonas lalkuanensis]|jgi:hypothetical protein|uniref:DUF2950 domain-containing protein n=1 Tax=Metapseudomonas lalkuanensis TaxID=2604832 RepID=UPI001CF4A54B|nr:DUF2950 domain-containing protein [Pseudomonas lalkuanensis]UCO99697.1 DUF2950 domain-containing protein [Pseudomonas lalkuanensis]